MPPASVLASVYEGPLHLNLARMQLRQTACNTVRSAEWSTVSAGLMEMGFESQVKAVVEGMPSAGPELSAGGRQTFLFTATWPQRLRPLATAGWLFRPTPIRISIATGDGGSGGPATVAGVGADQIAANASVRQAVEVIEEASKLPRLLKMLAPWCAAKKGALVPKALVFANTKLNVSKLCMSLQQAGAAADCLHGERDQRVRGKVLAAFAAGRVNLLVATDVLARGIDVADIAVVIN
eukprot:SAG11_NODE_5146_length_1649_cov_0.900000_1_plen_237_part_10